MYVYKITFFGPTGGLGLDQKIKFADKTFEFCYNIWIGVLGIFHSLSRIFCMAADPF